jgi:single-stranded-DNA-specific exonuclease
MDVIVCDHHLPPPVLPSATVILNPALRDCPYPFKALCGVGIAFKLLQAFFGPGAEEEVWPFLDLVALGTIADLVPLLGENRILVKHGLVELARSSGPLGPHGTAVDAGLLRTGGRPGLRALAELAGISLSDSGRLSVGRVAFGLAPRINAAGRLDDAASAVRMLLTRDPSEARELATGLDRLNRERQDLEETIQAEALARAESEHDLQRDRAIVLASPAWHPGVIGIVAARLVARFGRPTALIGIQEQEARGSARSAAGWHIADALGRCSDLLLHYGGHRAAAGFSLRPDRIEAFRTRFLALAAQDLTEEDLVPTLPVDAEVSLDGLDLAMADALERLAPHGVGNPEPVLVARQVQVMRTARRVGRNHLKMKVRQSVRSDHVIDAIGFNLGSLAETLSQPSAPRIDVAFLPERNVWNGREILQLRVKDVRLLDEDRRETSAD